MKNLTWQNPEQLFVAQELINKVKSKCCGIKDYVTVDHAIWKNVVAFETYKGKELTDICIVGTGDVTNKTTRVDYPTGATRIEAVGWDGSRTLVTGSR